MIEATKAVDAAFDELGRDGLRRRGVPVRAVARAQSEDPPLICTVVAMAPNEKPQVDVPDGRALLPARARRPRGRRRRRGHPRQHRRGPLRRRVLEHRPPVRRVLGPRRHVQVRPRQGPGHPRLGRGRGRHEGRRPPQDHDPAGHGLRQARRRRRDRPGRDAGLRRGPGRRRASPAAPAGPSSPRRRTGAGRSSGTSRRPARASGVHAGSRTIEKRLPSMARWIVSATIRAPTPFRRPPLSSASRRT